MPNLTKKTSDFILNLLSNDANRTFKIRKCFFDAVQCGNEKEVEKLIKDCVEAEQDGIINGDITSIIKKNGETAFRMALRYGHFDLAKKLIDLEKKYPGRSVDFEEQDFFGNQAIHIAAAYGQLALIESMNLDPVELSSWNHAGQSALHIAAAYGYVKIVQYLIEKSPFLVNVRDNSMNTVLDMVFAEGITCKEDTELQDHRAQVVQLLLTSEAYKPKRGDLQRASSFAENSHQCELVEILDNYSKGLPEEEEKKHTLPYERASVSVQRPVSRPNSSRVRDSMVGFFHRKSYDLFTLDSRRESLFYKPVQESLSQESPNPEDNTGFSEAKAQINGQSFVCKL